MRALFIVLGLAAVSLAAWLGLRAKSARSPEGPRGVSPDAMYPCPTIHDALPAMEEAMESASEGQLVLHEDEWRQIELVPAESLAEVQACLAELDAFKQENRVGPGYRKVFLRRELKASLLARGMTLEQVLGGTERGAVGPLYVDWIGGRRRVANGFSSRLPSGAIVYGEMSDGKLRVLALPSTSLQPDLPTAEALRAACTHGLALVDWQRGVVVRTSDGVQTAVREGAAAVAAALVA